ncbi:MAG: hypothetical protein ACREEM_29465 [Blastocatellia bacterium]
MKAIVLVALMVVGIMPLPHLANCITVRPLECSVQEVLNPILENQAIDSEWHAATFRGLKIGQSTLEDALRVLGKPKWVGPEADQDVTKPALMIYYSFGAGGEFPGEIGVIINKKSQKIVEIRNSPKELSKEDAIRHFGSDYTIGRYEFCPETDTTTAPIYSNSNGQLMQIEYRSRGIILHLDDDDTVGEVSYVVGHNVLSSIEDCKRKARPTPQRNNKRKQSRLTQSTAPG